ncbi:glycosyltransferase family 4 protein [Caenimonas soli]|uniref:glycosyltransferase family 4 protein n=1 Tax=Caenimonas soli TaxID=2735555 RepID=UPI001557E6A9|nr:glycosyltransferase family 4 protein [Caenimonas soli]NPC57536.1 glycosyltransferase family 4 protein [Caenimonas soli]
MKIAQVAPLYESVPPRAYGGTERVVSYLTEALVEMGHEVTLFASGDSVTSAHLVSVLPRSLRLDSRKPDPLVWHTIMMDMVLKAAPSFDVIHFHTDVLQLALVGQCRTPCMSTAHGRLDLPDLKPLFRCFPKHPMVSISASQRAPLPWLNWRATVHHGLPLGLYSLHPQPQDYFAFVGRISPEKRADRAIEIARACGTPLRIAAKVDPADQAYFESTIKPLLDDPLVTYVGEIGDEAKNDFIGNARALLMPIDWPEPFGLVMIEAMACGTPVIAYGQGSVPEILEDGVTGFIVENQEQAIAAARNIESINRRRCRQVFEQRFAARVMAKRYLEVYRELVDSRVGETRVPA